MRARAPMRQSGFSLLEVIVAISILAFIVMAGWYSFDGMVRMKETSELTEEVSNMGRIALQRIDRELQMSFLTLNPSLLGASYMTAFYGDDKNPMDQLTFDAYSHIRLYRESQEGDGTEITYFSAPDPDAQGLFLLLHREASRIDGKPEEGGTVEVLARHVRAFNLRYYDHMNQQWLDVWDSTSAEQNRHLPKAVEVTLTLTDPEGIDHDYATTVMLPMYATIPPANGPLPPRQK